LLTYFRLSEKFEEFECKDIHHSDCVFTDVIREELVSEFGNISYNEQGSAVLSVFKRTTRKRKGKDRKSIYCGVKLKSENESNQEIKNRLCDVAALHKMEVKKRKLAERVANKYYKEWKAERCEKDRALGNQVLKPTAGLPDSLYIKSELLNLESSTCTNDNIIGSGVFGTVKLCNYKGSCVAVKCLKRLSEESDFIHTEAELRRATIHEAKILLNLKSHESIPTLLGVSVDKEPFKIVMQFYALQNESVSLYSLCKGEHRIPLSTEQWHSLINRLAKGIDHVHSCGYLHNDIKTDNVVIYENNCHFIPVLVDFGKSCKRENGIVKHLKPEEQIIYQKRYKHIAPEIVDGSHKQSIYSDIYSFGYLVCHIFTTLCQTSPKLKTIVKECFKVKTWDCRASFAKVSMILES